MAKPIATGVNELRPPDTTAAHQAASTRSPDASPTASVSPAGASDGSSPTTRATQMPNSRHTAPTSKPWPMDSQTVPSASVIGNSANIAGLYRRGSGMHRSPKVRGDEAPGSATPSMAEVPAADATFGTVTRRTGLLQSAA